MRYLPVLGAILAFVAAMVFLPARAAPSDPPPFRKTATKTATSSATPTLTSTPTDTPSPIATPSQTPTPTPTSTPTVTSPIWGLGFVISDTGTESFWNAHMQPQDQAVAQQNFVSLVAGAVPGTRVVVTNDPSQVSATISLAQQYGLSWVGFGDESTSNCSTLASRESSASALVHAAGLQLVYIPMGVGALARCYQSTPQLVTQADRVVFQAQNWQNADPNFASDIHGVVSGVRALAPSHQVWVQLSANPPANPTITVTDLTSQIQSVQDGSTGQADGIAIWYSSTGLTTFEQVIDEYRP